ncbi:MAG: FAD-dependent oxidoreductase [Chitinophagaceae bacterium]|nr:FAD-dependent oxidoreductase [Chitinophagaceae bacterium]MBK8606992.1 FAD-dependent oxidoreductase [Chitinophagaceae bacterium]MBP6477210.1 FAD-dependent oxidoreductase [Chitinophagaceae bacterium]MBP7107864.1 FAD-dependent oxidoreductase [Chitinophagaceae bacterium]MBP7315802.1 FAD-dependent oxidoreductase [Chitinophagaceae bacterium]
MSSRRKFIQETAITTGGLFLASSAFSSFFIAKKPKVIIIGAGFAGLAAAKYLHKKGIDFVILEARNRISGRVFSHTIDEKENLIIELGAEWVGNSHERIQNLCNEFGLELQNNQFDTHLIYKGNYYKKNEWDYSEDWNKKFKAIIDHYPKLTQAEKLKIDKMDWWRFLVNNGCEGRDLDIRELLDSTDFGETIRSVSAFAALAEYAESSEKNEMDLKIKGGNSMLAKKIADKIGNDKIKLQHAVSRVVQNSKGGVTVYCNNGQKFTADKIICTAPTFAVKKIKWEPGLPVDQVNAMNELQYARINKNPIVFKKRFWNDESFDMITDQSPHYFYHATKNQDSKKGVLISYTIGEKAAVVANQTDEWRENMVLQTLKPHFNDVKDLFEKQTNYYWGTDEFSHGAYAMYGRGQWFRVMPILKRSHIHTHFAGEHLADWQGFMEGAINTGEEAAAKI